MRITQFFLKRPTLFWGFVIGILAAGIICFLQTPKLEDPAVAVKQAMVVVPYPGATAHDVELKVAMPLEDLFRTLPEVRRVNSTCQNGMAQISIEYALSAANDDMEQYFDLLRRKVSDNKSALPQDCYDPIIVDDMMDVYGIFYSLTGKGYTYSELEKYAKYIRRELLTVNGVKRISIAGTRREVINIIMDKERIAQNGLIPTMIMMQLQGAGKTVNAGSQDLGDQRLMVTVGDAVKDESDIADLRINTTDGKVVRLGDIATVKRSYAEPQTMGFFVNGEPALAICVAMNDDAIVPDVGKRVEAKMQDIMQMVPVGMETDKIFFQPDKVDTAINGFMLNLFESVLIVILVLMFAMGFKSSMIIGLGLVLTIALSFPVLLGMGVTLQRISLGAFIVAMGMLVDNAIVIMDGILVDRNKGVPYPKYLFRIGRRTMYPLLGATVIAASAFVCIYMSPGSAGEYAGDLFLVLCVSLLISWALALIQVPICADRFLSRQPNSKQKDPSDLKVNRIIRRWVITLIAHKRLAIACAALALILSGWAISQAKFVFFPDFDYKQFVIEYQLPAEAGPDRVRHDLLEITEKLKQNPGIERVACSMGTAPARYCLVRPITNGGDSYGELMVDCPDFETVRKVIPQLREELRAQYPDAYIRMRKYNFSIKSSHKVEAMFQGPDPAVLKRLSAQAEAIMRDCKYVDPYTVKNNWRPMGKTLLADYIQQDALRSGVQRGDVGNAILAATDGMPCGVLNDHDHQVVIQLQMRNADGSRITDLRDIPVWSTLNLHIDPNAIGGMMSGASSADDLTNTMFRSTPLSSVIEDLNLEWNDPVIYRVNGQRAIEAECDPSEEIYDATVATVTSDIQAQIEAIPLPAGYSLTWVGENDTSGEAIEGLIKYVPIPLFLILGILLALFNSFKKSLLILICFPFVICGIAPMLHGMRIPLTFMAIIGLMGLMGMMVKNAIVLMDEINRLQDEEHQHPYYAVVNATVSRVRPVLLASLTTILGMAPLLTDAMYNSMALCIMGGLAVGTIITLVLLPLFYTTIYRIRRPAEERK